MNMRRKRISKGRITSDVQRKKVIHADDGKISLPVTV